MENPPKSLATKPVPRSLQKRHQKKVGRMYTNLARLEEAEMRLVIIAPRIIA
jgi:hypothetical protein